MSNRARIILILLAVLTIGIVSVSAIDTCVLRFREGSNPSVLREGDAIVTCTETGENFPFMDLTSVKQTQIEGKKGVKVSFTLDGETEYDLLIRKVSNNSILTTVNGEGRQTLIGETDKVDLDKDGKSDVGVTLERIENGVAIITLKKIERLPAKPQQKCPEPALFLTPKKAVSIEQIPPAYALALLAISLVIAYVLLKAKKREVFPKSVKKLVSEDVMYARIFSITAQLDKLENKVSLSMYLMSLGFLILFKVTGMHIMLLTAVLSFGFSTSVLFRRGLDIRFGGMSTFALLTYYSLGNIWLLAHFLAVVFVCLPVGVLFMRKGYLGQMLFYVLSLVVFPVTIVSYYLTVGFIPPYSLLSENVLYHAGDVIYLVLPQIYLYSILQLEKKKIVEDVSYLILLLAASVALWVGIIHFIV